MTFDHQLPMDFSKWIFVVDDFAHMRLEHNLGLAILYSETKGTGQISGKLGISGRPCSLGSHGYYQELPSQGCWHCSANSSGPAALISTDRLLAHPVNSNSYSSIFV